MQNLKQYYNFFISLFKYFSVNNILKQTRRCCDLQSHKKVLFWWTFAESSFFPIPPDPYMILLQIHKKYKWYKIAFYTTIASVLGGIMGYIIGFYFYDMFLKTYIDLNTFAEIKTMFDEYGIFTIIILGFTPLPYKIGTIGAGIFNMSFIPFVMASFFGRGLRFFIVAWLVEKYGENTLNIIKQNEKRFWVLFFIILVVFIIYNYFFS